MFRLTLAGALAAFLAASPALAQDMATAKAVLKNAEGADVGSATFTQTPAGVLIKAELHDLPAGTLGFHLHEKGACEPPFESAGGHYNPTGAEHGFLNPKGPHAGDMPSIEVPQSGAITIEVLNTFVSLDEGAKNSLFDADGSALLIHAHHDDYKSQPAGEAGDRIACGIVEK